MADISEKFYLGRQPILDRKQEIVGYELLFRSAGKDYADFSSYSQACANVITSALTVFGIQEVLGGKFGFINVHLGLLHSEMLELLPIGQTVLELLEDIQFDDQVVERCRELKRLGFQLALDDHEYNQENGNIYGIVDIVKIDLLATDAERLPLIVEELRCLPVKILAEKVETVEQFNACYQMGMDLFQGYFFERPVVLNRNRIDDSSMAMLNLLQQITADAPFEEIEGIFRQNPSLSFNLLRLVNSVASGVCEKIKTLRHAITMLGIEQIRRWIQLSLFAGNDSRGLNSPLLEMAAVRGRLMEILILNDGRRLPCEQSEAAFMTGILSLLDVLFETPMNKITEHLNLADAVTEALLFRKGRMGDLLTLVERLELTDFDTVTALLDRYGISFDQLLAAQMEAFNWRTRIIS